MNHWHEKNEKKENATIFIQNKNTQQYNVKKHENKYGILSMYEF